MAVILTDAQKAKLVRVEQLATFKSLADNKYQDKTLAQATQGSFTSATTVEAALIELASRAAGDEFSFEKLSSPNTGKLATYRFTKGTGAGATTMDIDIEKDLLNKTFQLVTITAGTGDNSGKYYDGVTEVGSSVGVTGAGVYMKYTTIIEGGVEMFSYANMSGVIEYLTVGTQIGKAVTLSIVDNQITADIAEKAILKSHLAQSIQDSLDLADTALQSHQDISGKADKVANAVENNFAGLDSNGNLKDSGSKASDFKTKQTAVEDISAANAVAETGSTVYFLSGISQNANGEISASKKKIEIASNNDIRAIFGLDPES